MAMTGHCCSRMAEAVEGSCDLHPDRFECPDALLHRSARTGEYGIIIHDGGSSVASIGYCPWCGTKLPVADPDEEE